jgi:hypothetical protein
MLSAKSMNKESSSELKELINTYSQHVHFVKLLDYGIVGLSEHLVVHLLISRLDSETRKYVESFVKKN